MRSLLPLALLSALAACSATLGAQDTVDADTSAVAAVVVIEQSSGPGDALHTESFARFVRSPGGLDDTARSMVSAKLQVPAVGACETVLDQGAAPSRPLELLDVGALSLEGGGAHAALVARRVPDVVDLVHGVVYTTREAPAFGASITLRAAGSAELEPFSTTADAPAAMDAKLNGSDGLVVVSPAATHVDLTWTPGVDRVFVDVATSRASTRCSFRDEGAAALPVAADVTALSIHRVREAPLSARGVDEGTVRFDTSRAFTLVRR